ncbi:hypothetical protein E2986_12660 [Frieseomelitta varia]|uniref:Protein kinase domain-containing protein n=1 Tax=Frieseomelitta varia TaxID=561572 RepID=A0A833S8U9_9HYME|nr:hypothetical protein E2986_12660 [Frieseomelitta varia]
MSSCLDAGEGTFEFLQSSNQKYLHFLTRCVQTSLKKTNLSYISEIEKRPITNSLEYRLFFIIIVHFTPQNLVMMGSFPECEVKLCDFEISRVILEGTEVREILGTPDYVAPEILHYEPITLAADMWSVGVTTYVLLTGFSPFGGETDQETFQNISIGEVDFPEELFGDISAQAKDFVAKLLVLDPSARMTAKQCLRHDWLRGAPTQASPHLRRYLSKSREVLLERVVSRENLRRAALLSQASSQANLSSDAQDTSHSDQSLQDCLLSQSEMCLSHRLTGSRSSLEGSEDFLSPADSRTSLNSSRTNLSCASQSCLLNKEQTQGLLSRAQSRSQANLNHGPSRGLLSRIRSLNRIQSQACLLNENSPIASALQPRMTINPVISKSREKLYGLRSLSKSQGVLDIYRSLECLRRRRKSYQRAKTEDMVPIFKRLGAEIDTSNVSDSSIETTCNIGDHRSYDDVSSLIETKKYLNDKSNEKSIEKTESEIADEDGDRSTKTEKQGETKDLEASRVQALESEENFDSLKSIESDTLTEDSDETPVNRENESNLVAGKRLCQRQHSDVSSHSNNSGTSDDKEDRSTESETEEPKYTVAQLVSAFNKHQEVASRTSLEAIMSEKQVNEVTFPTGTKALRLFIPDINISESKIVRRKTSYKPRKNWEELRKKNEKNEGILKNFVDSGDEDEDNIATSDSTNDEKKLNKESVADGKDKEQGRIKESCSEQWSSPSSIGINEDYIFEEATVQDNVDTTIDEKYKQCVKGAKSMEPMSDKPQKTMNNSDRLITNTRQKERLPNYIYPEITCHIKDDSQDSPKKVTSTNGKTNLKVQKTDRTKPVYNTECVNVNLKDILQRVDSCQNNPKENMENLRKRTSITKIILNDNQEKNEGETRSSSRARSEPPLNSSPRDEDHKMKLVVPPFFARSSSLSSESSCPTPSSVHSDANTSWEDVQRGTVGSSVFLEKEDTNKAQRKHEIQRTSSEGKNKQCSADDKRLWGRVCTGSYSRAMEKFSKNNDVNKKSINQLNGSQQNGKIRRKSSPAMPQYINP